MNFHEIPVLGRNTRREISRFFFGFSAKKMAAKLLAPHLDLCQLQLGKTRSSSNSCLKASDIHVLRRNPSWLLPIPWCANEERLYFMLYTSVKCYFFLVPWWYMLTHVSVSVKGLLCSVMQYDI